MFLISFIGRINYHPKLLNKIIYLHNFDNIIIVNTSDEFWASPPLKDSKDENLILSC